MAVTTNHIKRSQYVDMARLLRVNDDKFNFHPIYKQIKANNYSVPPTQHTTYLKVPYCYSCDYAHANIDEFLCYSFMLMLLHITQG